MKVTAEQEQGDGDAAALTGLVQEIQSRVDPLRTQFTEVLELSNSTMEEFGENVTEDSDLTVQIFFCRLACFVSTLAQAHTENEELRIRRNRAARHRAERAPALRRPPSQIRADEASAISGGVMDMLLLAARTRRRTVQGEDDDDDDEDEDDDGF